MLFFCDDTASTEIFTLALHDALPISSAHPGLGLSGRMAASRSRRCAARGDALRVYEPPRRPLRARPDRKSTRLNSSHANISYAVFCLKKHNLGSTPSAASVPHIPQPL